MTTKLMKTVSFNKCADAYLKAQSLTEYPVPIVKVCTNASPGDQSFDFSPVLQRVKHTCAL